MIDSVLQLELPRSDAPASVAGVLPSLVIGPENRLLAAPVQRLLTGDDLAEAARLFNPLVLVGPAGSGKSQIAQGVVRHWQALLRQEERRRGLLQQSVVEYFTAADFGREAQAAAAEERLPAWQSRVRGLRVLVIEDLQRLRDRATIQQELRHTIDAIVESGGLVVVTVHREPAAIPQLDPGLRDRLSAGLTVRLQRPGLGARQAILRTTAASRGILLSDEELASLAHRDARSPAELIGRLASSSSSGSLPLAGRAGERGECCTRSTTPSPKEEREQSRRADAHVLKHIIAMTARYFTMTQAALTGPSRRTSLVEARNIVVHLARRLTGLSYAEIGRSLGGRDHTTIMHADRRLAEQLAHDPATQQAVDELDRLLS